MNVQEIIKRTVLITLVLKKKKKFIKQFIFKFEL